MRDTIGLSVISLCLATALPCQGAIHLGDRVFLAANEHYSPDSEAHVYGADGEETVLVGDVSGLVLDGNLERVELPLSLANYDFAHTGTTIEISHQNKMIARFVGLNHPVKVVFAEGAGWLSQSDLTNTTLSGKSLSTTPSKILADLDTAERSLTAGQVDQDGDGFDGTLDCDDSDPSVPGSAHLIVSQGGGAYSSTIQSAIDLAPENSTVCVTSGTYSESLVIQTEGISLRSVSGATSTIIDASDVDVSARGDVNGDGDTDDKSVIFIAADKVSRFSLTGFTLQGGSGTSGVDNNADHDGGGIAALDNDDTLTNDFQFTDLIIRNCSVDDDGGGMYIRGIDQLAMSNIRLHDNIAASSGGGARFSMSTISWTGGEVTNNRVSGTQVTIGDHSHHDFTGGGISSREGSITLENIQISGNSVVTANSVNKADGGGLSLFSSDNVFSNVEISNNTAAHSGGGLQVSVNRNNRFSAQVISVMNNQAGTDGGGVSLNFFDADSQRLFALERSTISGNTAGGNGGGLYSANQLPGTALLNHLVLSGNTASGNGGALLLLNTCETNLDRLTVAGNTASGFGGGIYLEGNCSSGNVRLNNSILAFNTALQGDTTVSIQGVTFAPESSDAYDLTGDNWGTWDSGKSANLTQDPEFLCFKEAGCEAWQDWDLNLKTTSPCLDTASDEGPMGAL